MNENYERLVQAVCQVLDGSAPGWTRNINLGTLRMICPQNCVLGQAFGAGKQLHHDLYEFVVNLIGAQVRAPYKAHEVQMAFANWDDIWKAEIARRQARGLY